MCKGGLVSPEAQGKLRGRGSKEEGFGVALVVTPRNKRIFTKQLLTNQEAAGWALSVPRGDMSYPPPSPHAQATPRPRRRRASAEHRRFPALQGGEPRYSEAPGKAAPPGTAVRLTAAAERQPAERSAAAGALHRRERRCSPGACSPPRSRGGGGGQSETGGRDPAPVESPACPSAAGGGDSAGAHGGGGSAVGRGAPASRGALGALGRALGPPAAETAPKEKNLFVSACLRAACTSSPAAHPPAL